LIPERKVTLINRRAFTKLSLLTAGATALPLRAQAQPRVRFAAVGLGDISDIFMRACAQSSKCKVTALVTGHASQKAPKYEQMYGISPKSVYNYENYDEIAHNPDIDAVYIGLPNSMHAEYTIRAAKAGKHVLCEKPMAISSAECRQMIDACRQANVKLMIAYRIHYDPMWQHIRDLARSGAIGEIQGFQGGFYGQKYDGWRLDRKLAGGGSLFDLGIYPLNAIRWICGEEPASYAAQVATKVPGPRFASVEESVEFSMKFPSGTLASSGCSYGENGLAYLSIDGSKGNLWVEPAFYYQGLKFRGNTISGPVDEVSPGKQPYQFTYEADHFADCIRNNTEPATPGEEGLKDLIAIEAIYRAAGAPVA
jgi:predicted dehydrogenase